MRTHYTVRNHYATLKIYIDRAFEMRVITTATFWKMNKIISKPFTSSEAAWPNLCFGTFFVATFVSLSWQFISGITPMHNMSENSFWTFEQQLLGLVKNPLPWSNFGWWIRNFIFILQENSCLINGYCFAEGDPNPTDWCYQCLSQVNTSVWTKRKGNNVNYNDNRNSNNKGATSAYWPPSHLGLNPAFTHGWVSSNVFSWRLTVLLLHQNFLVILKRIFEHRMLRATVNIHNIYSILLKNAVINYFVNRDSMSIIIWSVAGRSK